MYKLKKKLEKYLRVNLLGTGPRLMKKRIYGTTVLQRLRNIALPDNTQHSQQTDMHAPGRIRTHNFSMQAAADLRL
jgi:hypothetical protein